MSALAPAITHPQFLIISTNLLSECITFTPGIDSSLSKVPPVWPKPLPEIIGTHTPKDARSGARIIDTQSPIPPVECLSKTGKPTSHDRVLPLSRIAKVQLVLASWLPKPFIATDIANAPACASVTMPSASPFANQINSSRDSEFLHLIFESIAWALQFIMFH